MEWTSEWNGQNNGMARESNGSLPFHGHVWLIYRNGMIHYFVLFGIRKKD
ncbi:hypothetical protein Hanom_Chr04g00352691 [Helianthus anomalus]